jgi:hypothetical protein
MHALLKTICWALIFIISFFMHKIYLKYVKLLSLVCSVEYWGIQILTIRYFNSLQFFGDTLQKNPKLLK